MEYGLIPEFIGRMPVVAAIHQLTRERPDHDPDRAAQRARQAVPPLLRVRRHRAGLRPGLARRDRRQGPGARDRRPRPALDPRGDAARRPVRAPLPRRRAEVRRHQGDDRARASSRCSSPTPPASTTSSRRRRGPESRVRYAEHGLIGVAGLPDEPLGEQTGIAAEYIGVDGRRDRRNGAWKADHALGPRRRGEASRCSAAGWRAAGSTLRRRGRRRRTTRSRFRRRTSPAPSTWATR